MYKIYIRDTYIHFSLPLDGVHISLDEVADAFVVAWDDGVLQLK